MLAETLADLAPAGVAVALSPVPIVAIVLVLGSPMARLSGVAFAIAWVVGLVAVCSVVVLIAVGAEDTHSPASNLADAVKLAFGLLLIYLAARKWRSRDQSGAPAETPSYLAGLETIAPLNAGKLGLLFSVANPKNLVLALSAGASIAQAGLTVGSKALAIGAFALVGSLTVLAPLAFYLVDPDRAAAPLASVRQFMSDNSTVIVMVVMLVLGAKLIGDGIAGLLA